MSEMQLPTFTVKLRDKGPFKVVIPNGVQVQWELERARKGWPDSKDAPMTWGSFLAWAAAKRDGHIDREMPFEVFTGELEVLEFGDPVEANPTRGEAEEG